MKVLVVDDSQDKITTIRSILTLPGRDNIDVVVATNGLDAREILTQDRFDLLVLDIALPLREGDTPDPRGGINLLTELERSGRFKKPANVIALTGFANLADEFAIAFNNGRWSIELFDPSDSGWRDRIRAKAEYIYDFTQDSSRATYNTDICIITALATPELDFVRRLPWGFGPAVSFDSVAFKYEGALESGGETYVVTAISAPRMGMVASATLTTKVIQVLRPRMLVMAGICAGIPGEIELGDVVIADPAWDWQMGKYTKEAFEINPDQIPAAVEVTQRFEIIHKDRAALLAASDDFVGEKPNRVPSVKSGPMASGSAVIANEEITETVRDQNRKLMGFDMEMYGVYSAARDCSVPRPLTFGLKGVCDHADHYKNDKYQAYASHMSARVLGMFLERYVKELLPRR